MLLERSVYIKWAFRAFYSLRHPIGSQGNDPTHAVQVVMSEENGTEDRRSDDHELAERLQRLSKKLVVERGEAEIATKQASRGQRSQWAEAMKLSSEFIAAILVGVGFGYAIDKYFETTPWGLIIFLMLGFAAAILNVLRASGMVAESGMRLHKMRENPDEPGKDN